MSLCSERASLMLKLSPMKKLAAQSQVSIHQFYFISKTTLFCTKLSEWSQKLW